MIEWSYTVEVDIINELKQLIVRMKITFTKEMDLNEVKSESCTVKCINKNVPCSRMHATWHKGDLKSLQINCIDFNFARFNASMKPLLIDAFVNILIDSKMNKIVAIVHIPTIENFKLEISDRKLKDIGITPSMIFNDLIKLKKSVI